MFVCKKDASFFLFCKYNLIQCIYIHSFRNMKTSAWVLKRKQQRKDFNSHQFTPSESQYSSQTGNVRVMLKRYKMLSRRKTDFSRVSQHPQSDIFEYRKQYQTLGKVISWQELGTYACIYVFLDNIELAYKSRRVTKSKTTRWSSSSHVHQWGEGGDWDAHKVPRPARASQINAPEEAVNT